VHDNRLKCYFCCLKIQSVVISVKYDIHSLSIHGIFKLCTTSPLTHTKNNRKKLHHRFLVLFVNYLLTSVYIQLLLDKTTSDHMVHIVTDKYQRANLNDRQKNLEAFNGIIHNFIISSPNMTKSPDHMLFQQTNNIQCSEMMLTWTLRE